MAIMGHTIAITVAVCFYNAEIQKLSACLNSIQAQEYTDMQVLLVDDSSFTSPQITQLIDGYLKTDSRFTYISHHENRGTLEARRTSVQNATGEYLMWVDADDTLPYPTVVSTLALTAQREKVDLVCGRFAVIDVTGRSGSLKSALENDQANNWTGLYAADTLHQLIFVEHRTSLFIWDKLFSIEIARQAFDDIPAFFCVMQEPLLFIFFAASHVKSCFGITDLVYNYHIGQGVSTSDTTITLEDWQSRHITASLYTVIFAWLAENQHSNELNRVMQQFALTSIRSLLKRLNVHFEPQNRQKAYNILCEFWGDEIVKKVEQAMQTDTNGTVVP